MERDEFSRIHGFIDESSDTMLSGKMEKKKEKTICGISSYLIDVKCSPIYTLPCNRIITTRKEGDKEVGWRESLLRGKTNFEQTNTNLTT